MNEKKRKVRGVIFDLDGTLVDSRLDFEAMRRDLNFPAGAGILESIAAVECLDTRKSLEDIVILHETAGAEKAVPFPGAAQLLATLKMRGIQVAVFSRNSRPIVELTLSRVGLNIPLIVAREDAPPKPEPAGINQILFEWNLQADEALFIGDYLFDLEAGSRAGVQTLLFAPTEPDFAHDHKEIITYLLEIEQYLD